MTSTTPPPWPLPDESDPKSRRQIIERAAASSALEGFVPDEHALASYEA